MTRILAILLFLAAPAAAQVSASLSGTVTDQSGGLASAAAVTVKNAATGMVRATVTGPRGHYQFFSLPVGEYEVRGAKPGFTDEVHTGVELAVGQSATVDITLQVGESSQEVTVKGDAAMVSVNTAGISGLVGERQIKDLPLNGRSYDELLTLNPGVVNFTWEKTGGIGVSNSTAGNNFAVSGNRPQQNLFLLNGVEFTGAAENNMQPGGASQQLLGVDAVREFNVLTRFLRRRVRQAAGGAGADRHPVGDQPVARVAVTSSCATTPSTRAIFSTPVRRSGFQRNQFGARWAARFSKDKTFFFANYEGFRQHLHQTGVDLVPDANARNGIPALQADKPCAEPVPCLGAGVRGRVAADQRVARAVAPARPISAEFPRPSTTRCKPSATISARSGWTINSPIETR